MGRIEIITKHLRTIHDQNGIVKRDDLKKPGDIYHIKKKYSGFLDFCEANGFKTAYTKRMSKFESEEILIATITELKSELGRAPTSREVKERMRSTTGRSAIKLRFNDLLIKAGCDINRNTYLCTKKDVVAKLQEYFDKYGSYPHAEELKSTINIVPNAKVFKGGYIAFLIDNGLVKEGLPIKCGRVTITPTVGLDGHRYHSKCEAVFANMLFRNKITYFRQVGVGRFNGSLPLTIDFLVIEQTPIAVEIDGMGPLRDNNTNIAEKRCRCVARGWKWAVLSRDKVRSLCKRKSLASSDILASLA